jgi:methylated-DNA-[protein]-cysteine S-methyltransferase
VGWAALVATGQVLKQVVVGYPSPAAAVAALDPSLADIAQPNDSPSKLIARIQSFAAGARDDFRDVKIDVTHLTPFQQRVIACCRKVAYGRTCSYQDLAAKAGKPRAARAVGSTMAGNRYPLVVPCHRVISATGGIGSYSGPQGVHMKARLLEMEGRRKAQRVPRGSGVSAVPAPRRYPSATGLRTASPARSPGRRSRS